MAVSDDSLSVVKDCISAETKRDMVVVCCAGEVKRCDMVVVDCVRIVVYCVEVFGDFIGVVAECFMDTVDCDVVVGVVTVCNDAIIDFVGFVLD